MGDSIETETQSRGREIGGNRYRQYTGPVGALIKAIGAGSCLFFLLYAAGVITQFDIYILPTALNAIFLAVVLGLIFLLVPARKGNSEGGLPWYDALLILVSLVGSLYIAINALELIGMTRLTAAPFEIALGLATMGVILEAARRTIGWPMVIIGLLFFLYIKFGDAMPGIFSVYPRTWALVLHDIYLSTQGIFGFLLGLGHSIILVFITFGIFFIYVGGGKFFIDIALALVGSMRGGPAKAAIVGSALFGTLSGSPIANVVITGSITIPMMIQAGYKPHFAGAVESVASSGGVIMPPIMGAMAFIMADMIGVPYSTIAIAAAVPGILYFFALFVQVDLRAVKEGLRGLPRDELPSLMAALRKGWEFLIPFAVLVVLLFLLRWPVAMSGTYAILILIVVSMFRKEHRINLKGFIECLEEGFRSTLSVGALLALAGVLMAALVVTGVGPRLSSGLVEVAGGNIYLLVILAGIACYIMGMGVSILGAYILLAALVGPALVTLDVPIMATHFFILYMITSGFFTPPLCPVAFIAAPIAGADPFRIGFTSMKLGIVVFLVPFIIVFNPALILIGTLGEIVLAIVTAVIGVFALSVGIEGYLFERTSWLQRLLFLGGGIVMVIPGLLTDFIGGSIIAMALAWQWLNSRSLSRVR